LSPIHKIYDDKGHLFEILEMEVPENFKINHKCPFCKSKYHYKYFWGLLRHVENVHIPGGVCKDHQGCLEKKKKVMKILLDYVNENPSVKWKEEDLTDERLEEML